MKYGAAFAYLALVFVATVTGAVYLVTHDSPWWAAGCVFLGLTFAGIEIKGGD